MQKNPLASPPMPRSVWVLGFVSMLMDISSEMIHSLLPMFMVATLGASALTIGLMEGVADATTLIVKVFSGTLSDFLRNRKGLALMGYGVAAVSKPLFAIGGSIGEIFSARLLDRVGKGIRDAPRDALIADITPHGIRGAAFGLRQSLDTVGAIVGPLTAVGLMLLWNNDFRSVFWVASLPAVMCVALLYFGVQAPTVQSTGKPFNPITRENFKLLSHQFWWIVVLGACFALARFSEAFLVLIAQQCDVPMAYVPLIMMAMSIVYALTAYPFGKLSDDVSHVKLLAGGIAVLASADLVLASSKDWRVLLCGVVLWGIHMGMTQGVFASMVAKVAPIELRGTAFGIFNLASGFGLLLSSGLAGLMWDQWGAIATFYLGAAFCGLSFCVLVWVAWGNSLRILSK